MSYLSIRIAVFNAFCESSALLWELTILNEVFVLKSLMLYKFPHMTGLDETFISRVLLLINLGFVFLSQIPRLHLGGLYESYEFQILSGELFLFFIENAINFCKKCVSTKRKVVLHYYSVGP